MAIARKAAPLALVLAVLFLAVSSRGSGFAPPEGGKGQSRGKRNSRTGERKDQHPGGGASPERGLHGLVRQHETQKARSRSRDRSLHVPVGRAGEGLVRILPVGVTLRQVEHGHGRPPSHRRPRRHEEHGAGVLGRDPQEALGDGARKGGRSSSAPFLAPIAISYDGDKHCREIRPIAAFPRSGSP